MGHCGKLDAKLGGVWGLIQKGCSSVSHNPSDGKGSTQRQWLGTLDSSVVAQAGLDAIDKCTAMTPRVLVTVLGKGYMISPGFYRAPNAQNDKRPGDPVDPVDPGLLLV